MDESQDAARSRATVSVGIPTLNRPEWLRHALRSAISQTYTAVQPTVVDNGSADAAVSAVLHELSDPRIELIRNPTTIPRTANYNIALHSGDGKFVAILADDDEWMPDFLAHTVSVLEASRDVVLVHTGYEAVDSRGHVLYIIDRPGPRSVSVVPGQEYIKWILSGTHRIEFSASLMRRSAIPNGGFRLEDEVADDLGLLLRIATQGNVAFVNHPLVRIRYHEESVSAANGIKGSDGRYQLSLAYRAQCYEAKLRFLREYARSLPEGPRLRRKARRALRRHLLAPAAHALRPPTDIRQAIRSLLVDTAYDRWCFLDPEAWKFAVAAFVRRRS